MEKKVCEIITGLMAYNLFGWRIPVG
jgi:hypothetical protein